MRGLFNFVKGYVKVKVRGFAVERFVNLAVHNNIYIWDMVRDLDYVTFNVTVHGFKLLKKYARKTGCKTKIVERHGLPFFLHKYSRRQVFVIGFAIFISAMYIVSSFVWQIDVVGTSRLSHEDILQFCNQHGFKIGSFKPKINPKAIEKLCLNNFHDISWINIHIKGTRATMQVKEIIPKESIIDRNTPCNIVAKKDGLIYSINTSTGTPCVKQKDVVKKGDVLVSGEVLIENNNAITSEPSYEYVHADSTVIAKTYHEYNFKIQYREMTKKYTGKMKKGYGISILNKRFNYNPRIRFENYDKIIEEEKVKLGDNYPLPITIFKMTYREFEPFTKKISVSEAKIRAQQIVNSCLIRDLAIDSEILNTETKFKYESDGLFVKSLVTTLERIDEEHEIN